VGVKNKMLCAYTGANRNIKSTDHKRQDDEIFLNFLYRITPPRILKYLKKQRTNVVVYKEVCKKYLVLILAHM
jgi:CRISPR/Cas system-associated endonuclease Cas3-HD